ncbi:hypothetical protein Mal52_20880 [Symmachiella dynata]|uniref:Heparan-alpha-glucosaminide N-acetyltransferase catalytic domain-containing protein n=1 Tax=Symmachiella dynata TaxID=2527995 RepID=A0A517ZMB1_9PLAN|nr:heparan-alpha-glucosaminide N-acetyltransferase domain-containing protein [Symmachiella dynata]QDU43612.1 hypothetical protein Mal52_20880 [Symmachiella dynata]
MSSSSLKPARIASLDQFRGYTVAGMFLVNFLGGFTNCPQVLKHSHNYLSYADTIMPHFLFAVGFAFRLTFGRRISTAGVGAAYRKVVTRFLGLMLVAIAVYGSGRAAESWEELQHIGLWGALYSPLKREWFQTLMHIALTAIWITPVIRSSAGVRIAYMFGSAALHVLLSHSFNFEWCSTSPNVIDGGPIGVLTWSIPALLGTLTCDAVAGAEGRPNLFKMFAWSIVVMGIGWLMTCGTRLYDVTETQIAEREQDAKMQKLLTDEINGRIAPLKKELGELGKTIAGLRAQLDGMVLAVEQVTDPEEREKLNQELKAALAKDSELRDKIDVIKVEFQAYRDGTEVFISKQLEIKAKLAGINAKLNGSKTVDKVVDEKQRAKLTAQKEALIKEDAAAAAGLEELKANPQDPNAPQVRVFRDPKLAIDPVFPSQARIDALKARFDEQGWRAIVAEPPFVYPPHTTPGVGKRSVMLREWNYWMVSQRQGTLSYTVIAGGMSIFLYAIFYIACDIWGLRLGLFTTFGTNALFAYALHPLTGGAVKAFMPRDVATWYMWLGFAVFMLFTWLFVRVLEKNNIYIKL